MACSSLSSLLRLALSASQSTYTVTALFSTMLIECRASTHIFPMLLMYSLRFPSADAKAFNPFSVTLRSTEPTAFRFGECSALDRWDLWNYFLLWLLWTSCYMFITEVLCRDMIARDPTLVTNVRFLCGNEKGSIYRIARLMCRRIGVMAKGEKFDATLPKTKFRGLMPNSSWMHVLPLLIINVSM